MKIIGSATPQPACLPGRLSEPVLQAACFILEIDLKMKGNLFGAARAASVWLSVAWQWALKGNWFEPLLDYQLKSQDQIVPFVTLTPQGGAYTVPIVL